MYVLKTVLYWVITQRVAVIPYRRFGTTYQSYRQDERIKKKGEVCSFHLPHGLKPEIMHHAHYSRTTNLIFTKHSFSYL
jgi:hypothetical protein